MNYFLTLLFTISPIFAKVDIYIKECNLGDINSCHRIGIYYLHKENYLQAKRYFEESCYFNNSYSCLEIGKLFQYGRGVSKDISKAKIYYEKSCNLGDSYACNLFGDILKKERKTTKIRVIIISIIVLSILIIGIFFIRKLQKKY